MGKLSGIFKLSSLLHTRLDAVDRLGRRVGPAGRRVGPPGRHIGPAGRHVGRAGRRVDRLIGPCRSTCRLVPTREFDIDVYLSTYP